MSGQALYVGADGIGAIVGGPPPIEFKLTVVFLEDSNELKVTAHQGNQHKAIGRMKFDAAGKTLTSLHGVALHRVFDDVTNEMRAALGLPTLKR